MSCGVPVIGCRAGGLPEVVLDGETGFLFDVGNVGGMAESAARLLRAPDERARLGEAARRRAASVYAKDAVVGRYEAFYERMLA
jgi:glycosyltransferase involved in cell wall biosynthesis